MLIILSVSVYEIFSGKLTAEQYVDFTAYLSLERLGLDEREGKVCYRYGEGAEEEERLRLPGVHRPGHFSYSR